MPDATERTAMRARVPSASRWLLSLNLVAASTIQPSVPLPDFSVEAKISATVVPDCVPGSTVNGRLSTGGSFGATSAVMVGAASACPTGFDLLCTSFRIRDRLDDASSRLMIGVFAGALLLPALLCCCCSSQAPRTSRPASATIGAHVPRKICRITLSLLMSRSGSTLVVPPAGRVRSGRISLLLHGRRRGAARSNRWIAASPASASLSKARICSAIFGSACRR